MLSQRHFQRWPVRMAFRGLTGFAFLQPLAADIPIPIWCSSVEAFKKKEQTWKWNNQIPSAKSLCDKRHGLESFLHHLPAEWFGVYGISLNHSFSFWKHSKWSINRALVKWNDHDQRLSPLWNLAQRLILGCSDWLLVPLTCLKESCLHFYLPLNLSLLVS